MKANRFLIILTLMSVLLAPNCATLTQKRTQSIPVTSSPVGATVSVNGVQKGVTPLEISLTRGIKDQIIRIEYPDYNPLEIRPKHKLSNKHVIYNALIAVACAVPTLLIWTHGREEEDPWAGFKAIFVGPSLVGGGYLLLFEVIDITTNKGYEFKPRELTVTLTKADGTPRVDTIYMDADDLRNIKWIRVHRD